MLIRLLQWLGILSKPHRIGAIPIPRPIPLCHAPEGGWVIRCQSKGLVFFPGDVAPGRDGPPHHGWTLSITHAWVYSTPFQAYRHLATMSLPLDATASVVPAPAILPSPLADPSMAAVVNL